MPHLFLRASLCFSVPNLQICSIHQGACREGIHVTVTVFMNAQQQKLLQKLLATQMAIAGPWQGYYWGRAPDSQPVTLIQQPDTVRFQGIL